MKYRVTIPYACYVTVEVEAENKEEAEEAGLNEAYISGYCGNGGSDKLIGVSGHNISIEASDEPIFIPPFEIDVVEA